MLSEAQTREIKKQLISQIEKNFPADKKDFAIQQIQGMNAEQLETFLRQNNFMIKENNPENSGQAQCVFCAIVSGQIQSYKINENSTALAVLEINPISRGHIIIIPKKHISSEDNFPKSILSFAEKVSKTLKGKLKPKPGEIKHLSSNIMGHEIINLIPLYEDTDLNAERKPASQEELMQLQQILSSKPKLKPKIVRKQPRTKKPKPKEKLWLPKRIP